MNAHEMLMGGSSTFKEEEIFIQESRDLVQEALTLINDYQMGIKKPIKFRKDFVNKSLLGGLFPGTVLGIGGMSGMGKTHFSQSLENDIFDKELNPDCDNYILLRNNFEMSVFKLFLRDLKTSLNKNIADILSNQFSEDELERIKGLISKSTDPRIKYFQNPTDPLTWLQVVEKFIKENIDKDHIVISIDHIALIKQTSSGKKDAIDVLIEGINVLKKRYTNVSFIILSQLNRNIEERDSAKNSAPKKGDLYQSDFLYQLSDVIVIIHNPYKLGLQEHMVFAVDKYSHLEKYKKQVNKSKWTSFITKGLIFYHFIKLREDENQTLSDVYVEELKPMEKSKSFTNLEVPLANVAQAFMDEYPF